MQKEKNNSIKKGIRINKKLKSGLYKFIYDKHFDWAVILGCFFVVLPYVATKLWYFLIIKLLIVGFMFYYIGKYLLTWNSLKNYYEKKRNSTN